MRKFFYLMALVGLLCSCSSKKEKRDNTRQINKDIEAINKAKPEKRSSVSTSSKKSINFYPTSTTGEVVKHTAFALSYSEKYEQAEWVAYEVTKENLLKKKRNKVDRTDDFREDKKVRTGSAELNDFRGTGYDRGHLAPAGSVGYTKETMSESFYLSNMSPQEPSFNRGIWKELEEQVRDWAYKEEALYVVSGPVLKGNLKTVGKYSKTDKNDKKIAVPKYYYKIIVDRTGSAKAIAFLMPNEKSDRPLSDYVVSIDKVEEITGIDFFHTMNDNVEDRIERSASTKGWFK